LYWALIICAAIYYPAAITATSFLFVMTDELKKKEEKM
jgi:hypothetical protein